MLLYYADFALPATYYGVPEGNMASLSSGGPYDGPYLRRSSLWSGFFDPFNPDPAGNVIYLFMHYLLDSSSKIEFFFYEYSGGPLMASFEIDLRAHGMDLLVWRWLGIKVVFDPTSGSYEWRINGQTIVGQTGVDTQGTASTTTPGFVRIDHIRYGGIANLLICDDVDNGDGFSDWVNEEIRIVRRLPENAGNYTGFTSSTVDANWENVDDVSVDGDTSHNESGVVGAKDSFAVENAPVLSGFAAKAVAIDTIAKKTDTAATKIRPFTRLSGVDSALAEHTLADTYLRYCDILGPMSETDFNALEIGYELTAA